MLASTDTDARRRNALDHRSHVFIGCVLCACIRAANHLLLRRLRRNSISALRLIVRRLRGSMSHFSVNLARGIMAFAIEAWPPAEPISQKASFNTRPAART